jgi:hypothetical protein
MRKCVNCGQGIIRCTEGDGCSVRYFRDVPNLMPKPPSRQAACRGWVHLNTWHYCNPAGSDSDRQLASAA